MSSRNQHPAATTEFCGAALIDAQGREIPITENMLQDCFRRLMGNGREPMLAGVPHSQSNLRHES